nr:oligosaccharide flippase family protein [Roseicella aerolata]
MFGLGTQLPVLVSFVLVARWVTPEDFGTMAIAWIIAGLGQIFLLETLGDAIVRRSELGDAERDATFWTGLALGLGFALLTAATAGLAAAFFGNPALSAVLPVLALRLVFDGLAIVPDALLRRAYALRKLALRTTMANGLAAVAAVLLARQGHGVWALVMQQVVLGAVTAAVAWGAAPFRPRLSRLPPRDVLTYFRSASLFRSVDFSSANLDRFLLGRFRGPAELGLYSVAGRVQALTLELIVGTGLRLLALPLLARAGSDRAALRRAYLAALRFLSLAAFPCLAGLGLVAGLLVPALFGENWRPAVPLVQILMAEALVGTLAMLNGTLLRAIGKPQRWLLVQSVAFILGTVLVLAAVRHGVALVALAILAKAILLFPLHFALVRRACGFAPRDYVLALLPAAMGTLAMAAVVLGIRAWLEPQAGAATLFGAMVLAGGAAYAAAVIPWFRHEIRRALARRMAGGARGAIPGEVASGSRGGP